MVDLNGRSATAVVVDDAVGDDRAVGVIGEGAADAELTELEVEGAVVDDGPAVDVDDEATGRNHSVHVLGLVLW